MAVFSVSDSVRHDYKDKVKMSQTKKCGGDKIDLDEDDDVAVGESIRSKGEAPGRCGPSAPRLLQPPGKGRIDRRSSSGRDNGCGDGGCRDLACGPRLHMLRFPFSLQIGGGWRY